VNPVAISDHYPTVCPDADIATERAYGGDVQPAVDAASESVDEEQRVSQAADLLENWRDFD
jgi:hypothetical protein